MQKTLHPPHSIDHHHRWRMTLAIMFIAQFLSGVGFSFVLPFLPFYFRSLGVESQNEILIWNAWASLVFGITMTFFALFWGLLSDRYGRKIMVMRSMFAGSIVLGLMGFATSPWHLVALRFLQGATTGTVSASITLVSSITPSANLGISL
ncbi:MAG: MFS transporter, partial [Candidatus Latescibacteria bacterium]|nr:MFS transporter [Candidatus Latescibacterota bacterium]